MKDKGFAKTVNYLVCFDSEMVDSKAEEECRAKGIKLLRYDTVMGTGRDDQNPDKWERCGPEDCPIFSYTSGTTGDSKGVKLSHKNILASAYTIIPHAQLTTEESMISYLPYPHSFEQVMTFYTVCVGSKIGYY